MLDCHCHLDLYPEPLAVADRSAAAGVFTILVTNLPSTYEKSSARFGARPSLRLALGLHPLLAKQHDSERDKFMLLAQKTSFIGEVGLDFSAEGRETTDIQVKSFEFVLTTLGQAPKFVSIHSRRAEKQVLELLRQWKRPSAIFHWYSGPLKTLNDALSDGHYFSVNPEMVRSPNGQKIVLAMPRERVLTETDGPFVIVGKRTVEPADVRLVERELARLWKVSALQARAIVAENFRRLVAPLRTSVFG